MKKHDKLVKKFRNGSIKKRDKKIINNLFKSSCFERGRQSVLNPDHYKAFEIIFHNLDLDIDTLKEKRKEKNEKF